MNLLSAIAVYFIIWWLMLFLTLPFGVRVRVIAGQRTMVIVEEPAVTA